MSALQVVGHAGRVAHLRLDAGGARAAHGAASVLKNVQLVGSNSGGV
jgi:hypothetical protein